MTKTKRPKTKKLFTVAEYNSRKENSKSIAELLRVNCNFFIADDEEGNRSVFDGWNLKFQRS